LTALADERKKKEQETKASKIAARHDAEAEQEYLDLMDGMPIEMELLLQMRDIIIPEVRSRASPELGNRRIA